MRYSHSSRRPSHQHGCSGFSLIELLLALAISTIALLGFAQLQQKNLSTERELIRSLQARLLLNEISAVLYASPHPEYYLSSGNLSASASNCFLKECNPREFAGFQLALWGCRTMSESAQCRQLGITKPLFPQGKLIINRSGQHFLIKLKWQTLLGKEQTITQRAIPLRTTSRSS